MRDLLQHKDDFGLLLGIGNMDVALDHAMNSVWIPYWKNLPRALQTPRRLISDKAIVYSLIEAIGTRIVSERVDLEDQLKAQQQDASVQRHAFLRTLATTAEYAAACEAFDVSYSADETDPDEPFTDMDEPFDASDLADPLWKVCITFTNAKGSKKITNILTHQEFVLHFSSVATVVSADPDPNYVSELEDAFNSFNASSVDDEDDLFSSRGPTLR